MDQPVKSAFDPVHDYLHYERQPLDAIFAPKNVAVIGATETEGSVGRTHIVEPDQQPIRRDGLSRSTPSVPASWASRRIPASRRCRRWLTWPSS